MELKVQLILISNVQTWMFLININYPPPIASQQQYNFKPGKMWPRNYKKLQCDIFHTYLAHVRPNIWLYNIVLQQNPPCRSSSWSANQDYSMSMSHTLPPYDCYEERVKPMSYSEQFQIMHNAGPSWYRILDTGSYRSIAQSVNV